MPRTRSTQKITDKARYRQSLTESIRDFIQVHGIDKQRFTDVMREVFMEVLSAHGDKSENAADSYRIILDSEKGDLEIYRLRKIVPDHEVEDEAYEVPFSEALEKEPDCTLGETLYEEVSLESLSRAQIERLKEKLRNQLRDLDRTALYERYKQMVGEIITGDVLKITRDELIVLHEGNELSLPRNELIPEKDKYVSKDRMGSRFQRGLSRRGEAPTSIVKAVVERVLNPREISSYRPIVILSRTSPSFLKALLKLEIPEIYDGIISIKKVVRHPGKRAKVLVESYDERIDPV
ncbi:MAG: hypothetical protein NZ580_03705, partial [Bacteroidia bacterium]|nr:hypothetical protein [Bacteroidia bacterium]